MRRLKPIIIVLAVELTLPSATFGEADAQRVADGRTPSLVASDAWVLDSIFAEQHVTGTALQIHHRALGLPLQERFDWLSKWILPNDEHQRLRLQYAFAPVDLATTGEPGGRIVSPVYDLIDAARELSRLDELQLQIDQAGVDPFRTAAMQTLLGLAIGNTEEAVAGIEAIDQFSAARASKTTPPSSAEFLVLNRAREHEATREIAGAILLRYEPWMKSTFSRSAQQRHLAALIGRLRLFETQATTIDNRPLKHWKLVSQATAETRGAGHPASVWTHAKGHVSNVASHHYDFLYFDVPMRGNYEVECDVSVDGWRDICLMTAGTWVIPTYRQDAYDVGHFMRSRGRTEFAALTRVPNWMPYRTVVRDGTATTYLTGRKVHVEALSDDHDPWLAIRSTPRHHGQIRNLRITGDPVVPDQIAMATDPELDGWVSYDEPSAGGRWDHWKHIDGEIQARRSPTELAHPHRERLLRYHRPMFEDGTIEYEFQYEPGTTHVHPALDRMAVLLQPDGVRVHWITDGKHDRIPRRTGTPARPARGPGRAGGVPVLQEHATNALPLRRGEWNKLKVQLSGDVLSIRLNDSPVYEQTVSPTNDRTFGLFHFEDATAVRARNFVWKGDWPDVVPPVEQQELAAEEHDFVDRDGRLKDEFRHDFAESGLAGFATLRGKAGRDVRETPDGIAASRSGGRGYRNATIAPSLQVHGDFDITAAYSDYYAEPMQGANASLMLVAILDSTSADECGVMRRSVHHNSGVTDQVAHCFSVIRKDDDKRRAYFGWNAAEESSGRLRLSRRGDQVYFLTAEGDSSAFRLRAQRTFPTDDVAFEGIRLIAQATGEGGEIGVTWNNLVVRAEKLISQSIPIEELNRQRDALAAEFAHDFSKLEPTDQNFYVWNDPGPWTEDAGGWLMTSVGAADWTSSGAAFEKTITGDFDLAVEFAVRDLAMPKAGDRSGVYLQLDLPGRNAPRFNLMYALNEAGTRQAIAEIRTTRSDGEHAYDHAAVSELPDVTALRIARRGTEYSLIAESTQQGARLLARRTATAGTITQGSARLLIHTGGPDRKSTVLWKSLNIRAESIQAKAGTSPVPVPPPLRRLIDFFQNES